MSRLLNQAAGPSCHAGAALLSCHARKDTNAWFLSLPQSVGHLSQRKGVGKEHPVTAALLPAQKGHGEHSMQSLPAANLTNLCISATMR